MDEPERTILDATSRILCEHGDADLPMQRIADESEPNKAAIHSYYDSTEHRFEQFLDFRYDRYTGRLDGSSSETAFDHSDKAARTSVGASLVDENSPEVSA